MVARLVLLACLLSASGCAVTPQFYAAVEDHLIQTATIVRWCETGTYSKPCSPELLEDVEAMRDQAAKILEFTELSRPRLRRR